jgi:hypothetical protein
MSNLTCFISLNKLICTCILVIANGKILFFSLAECMYHIFLIQFLQQKIYSFLFIFSFKSYAFLFSSFCPAYLYFLLSCENILYFPSESLFLGLRSTIKIYTNSTKCWVSLWHIHACI